MRKFNRLNCNRYQKVPTQVRSGKTAPETRSVQRVHARIEVSRNDPCPCGSGKKFKKCCYIGFRC